VANGGARDARGHGRASGTGRGTRKAKRVIAETSTVLIAVVHRLAFDAPGLNVLALTDAGGFRQLERARFTPFVHSGLTRTRKRLAVHWRKGCAPGKQSRTSQDCPFHARVSRVYCPKSECAQRRKRRPPAWMSAPADQNGIRSNSLSGGEGGSLGSLDSGANVTRATRSSPYGSEHAPSMQHWRAFRAVRHSRLLAGRPLSISGLAE
jgi:hypothetical protein